MIPRRVFTPRMSAPWGTQIPLASRRTRRRPLTTQLDGPNHPLSPGRSTDRGLVSAVKSHRKAAPRSSVMPHGRARLAPCVFCPLCGLHPRLDEILPTRSE
jgi:hypothetical protein